MDFYLDLCRFCGKLCNDENDCDARKNLIVISPHSFADGSEEQRKRTITKEELEA